MADVGRPGPLSGDGLELREIREHQHGDSFKRIAWKASARRNKLLVRDYEQEERDVVWLILDASVELWAGKPGTAPLDIAIDEVAAVAQAHLGRGDHVGLAVCGARILAWHPPNRGVSHFSDIVHALGTSTSTLDADRSDLDETDVALRVIEHLRPLDPKIAAGQSARDPDSLARRAQRVLHRAPFSPVDVLASGPTQRTLRQYLSAFGMSSPARLEPDRPKTDAVIADALRRVVIDRPRPSLVFLWSPAPDPASRPTVARALETHPTRRAELRWVRMRYDQSIPRDGSAVARAVGDAVALRTEVSESHGERALRHLGVRIERLRSRPRPDLSPARHVGRP